MNVEFMKVSKRLYNAIVEALPNTEAVIFGYMVANSNKKLEFTERVAVIGNTANKSIRTARRVVKSLREKELLEVVEQKGEYGARRANLYRLNPDIELLKRLATERKNHVQPG